MTVSDFFAASCPLFRPDPWRDPEGSVFFAIVRLAAGLAPGARPAESCLAFAALFCKRRLWLPLIEPRQPPSKGAQKRLLADVLRLGSLVGRTRAPTFLPALCRHEWRHGTHECVRHVWPAAPFRACAGGASLIGPAESRPLPSRSHPRWMTTKFGEQLETVQAWKRSRWSGDLCPFRFLPLT